MKANLTHLIVLDFEATCDDGEPPTPQEIIEFPSILLSADTYSTLDAFESFVRPRHHPTLSTFCRDLTGIEQADVDRAPPFREVLAAHMAWLESHGLPLALTDGALPYAFVTCGDWDLQTMLPAQLRASDPPFDYVPHPYRRWVNIKRPFERWSPGRSGGMASMLKKLDLTLEGRHHRGIDDCRNIAKIVRALGAHGQPMSVTGHLPLSRYPPLQLVLHRGEERGELTLRKRSLATLLGEASGVFRAQAKRAFLAESGERLSDVDLLDLRDGVAVRVE